MADEIDIANHFMDVEVSRALNKMRQNNAKSSKGSEFCVECGENMPEARRDLGFQLCVPCASEAERKNALFAN